MPTKDHRRYARVLVEELESRVHAGPPVGERDLEAARKFLHENDFSTASDYFHRLGRIQNRIEARPLVARPEKRNYGGEAAGYWMQIQSIYDHIILSVCYDGEFNLQRGRVKISHRFNQAGRIDFVELKFLKSFQPCLNGAIRKLVTVCQFQDQPKHWLEAEAYALRVQPRELVLLCADLFRFPRNDILAWLVNTGHWIAGQLLSNLRSRPINGSTQAAVNGNGGHTNQLNLKGILTDEVAMPILRLAASLTSTVELHDADKIIIRYAHK